MFQHVEAFAGDAIVALNEAFHRDPRPHKVNLSIGIYSDEHGRARDRVRPVLERLAVDLEILIILLDLLDARAVGPRKGQILAVALEVVFDMAVGTHHAAHLLAAELIRVLALGRQRLAQRRVGHDQLHGARLMTVGAGNGLLDQRLELAKGRGIEPGRRQFRPQTRVVGALARHAGAGCRIAPRLHDIGQGPVVTAILLVIGGEGVAGEQRPEARVSIELLDRLRSAIRSSCHLLRPQPAIELMREVHFPLLRVWLHRGNGNERLGATRLQGLIVQKHENADQGRGQRHHQGGQQPYGSFSLHEVILLLESSSLILAAHGLY